VLQASGIVNIKNVHFSDDNFKEMYRQVSWTNTNYGGLLINQKVYTKLTVKLKSCLFSNTRPNSNGAQMLTLQAENITKTKILINDTKFVNSINNWPIPDNHGSSLVYIKISCESCSHVAVMLSNVIFRANTIIFNTNASILLVVINGDRWITGPPVYLQSCTFLNNTASYIASIVVKDLSISNSTFQGNNGKSTLVSIVSRSVSIKANSFSNNFGGPLLSLSSGYLSGNFHSLQMLNNTLLSGHGLVVLSNLNYWDVNITATNSRFNHILTDGSAFHFTTIKEYIEPLFRSILSYKLSIANITVESNSGGGHGAGIHISHLACTYYCAKGVYKITNSIFNEISNVKSVLYIYSDSSDVSHSTIIISSCNFTNNFDTAIHILNSELIFSKGFSLFESNTAEHGAALYFDLNSNIIFQPNSHILFSKNQATRYGGAIYCDISEYNNCFQNISKRLSMDSTLGGNNTVIRFNNNKAGLAGDSIYFSISQSCDEVVQSELSNTVFCEQIITSPKQLILDIPARLMSDPSEVEGSTSGAVGISENFTYSISNIMLGQDIRIPACVLDYNSKPTGSVTFSVVPIENTNYSVNGNLLYSLECGPFHGLSNLQITGQQPFKDQETVTIQINSLYDTAYKWKPIQVKLIIKISPCHSGFHYNDTDERCVCYTTDGVVSCSGSNATIRRGYWFGVINKQPTVGVCPVNYCDFHRCDVTSELCSLSLSPDDQCGYRRTGTACGNCKDGYTLSFDSVDCISTTNCTAGLTALVVVMTCLYWIFTVIVVFAMMYFKVGIGYLYGITFYYSVIDILLGQALHTSNALYKLVTIVSSLARLTPQFLGQLCFMEGLGGIDQQFIHYIHPLAVVMILLLISISAKFSPRLSLFVSRGVIHVICFLLLLSYTSIASTSLLLMRPLTFTGVDKVYTHLSPDLEYFHSRHLAYGLVSIACGLIIVIGFPLILLLEPFLNHKINFIRIKPILDQFQGYYRNKYRYFASYYMICRLVMLLIVNTYITSVYTVAYLQLLSLITMALIHFIVRPYISITLNAVDGFFLLTMILVAILEPFEASNGFAANTIIGLAFTLVVLPLLVFLFMITPFMNRQRIKEFIKFCMSSVFSVKKGEPKNKDIKMPNINKQYEVTVDDALRESTAKTIV